LFILSEMGDIYSSYLSLWTTPTKVLIDLSICHPGL
jgi:hypothetical protein